MLNELIRICSERAAQGSLLAERAPTLADYHESKPGLGEAIDRLWDAMGTLVAAFPWQWTSLIVLGVIALGGVGQWVAGRLR